MFWMLVAHGYISIFYGKSASHNLLIHVLFLKKNKHTQYRKSCWLEQYGHFSCYVFLLYRCISMIHSWYLMTIVFCSHYAQLYSKLIVEKWWFAILHDANKHSYKQSAGKSPCIHDMKYQISFYCVQLSNS